jgi:hypothetical protein
VFCPLFARLHFRQEETRVRKLLAILGIAMLTCVHAQAGTITGQIQTATSGPVPNGTLTLELTQAAIQSGTALVVTTPVSCYTDSGGNVRGVPTPGASTLSINTASGTLAAGTYYVRTTWSNATGESEPSAEQTVILSAQGTVIVTPPVTKVPAVATNFNVYLSSAPGTETKQGTVAVSGGSFAAYSQTAALISGSALPSSNTSVCSLLFNDQLQPSFTGYRASMFNSSGGSVAGFPQRWYLSGGASGTINLSLGTPLYSGVVQYPQAIQQGQFASLASLAITGTQQFTFGATATRNAIAITDNPLPNNSLTNVQWDYMAVALNGVDFLNEQAAIGRSGGTQDAVAGGIHVPSTQTFISQLDAVAGYIHNESAGADPVAIYGQARADYNVAPGGRLFQSWAANLLCSDTAGMTQNGSCYGLEIDVNMWTAHLGGWALDLNGNFGESGGSGNTYGGMLLVKPGGGAAKYWNPGFEFGLGATPAISASGPSGALIFLPVATGNSQASQGLVFEATSGGGAALNQGMYETSNGDILFTNLDNSTLTASIGYSGYFSYNRAFSQFGSAVVSGDFALSGGWGATASIASVRGDDALAQVQVTANGAGIAANPNIAFTFHDGTFGSPAAISMVSRCDANSPQTGNLWIASASNTTSVTIFFLGTPVAGNTYCANIQTIRAKN